jgi:hypothetical protein
MENNLNIIPSDIFNQNNAVSFIDCFQQCTYLTTIPSTLFDPNHTKRLERKAKLDEIFGHSLNKKLIYETSK